MSQLSTFYPENIAAIKGTTGFTDNSLLRADGVGGLTAQPSALVVDDAVVTFSTITGNAGTDIITATGSAFANGQRIRFTALTGGSGLNTTTNYFVINASGATFQVSTSEGGSASLFTTNITAGTLLTGHSVSPHVAIRNNSSDTNSVMVIAPKGTGALVAQIPDGATTGGNARGGNAVDLQTARVSAAAVASGQYAAIAGGYRNTASNTSCSVGGGEINSATGQYGRVGGGKNNTAGGGDGAVVGGGENNVASGAYAFVGSGYVNAATGQSSVVAGGGWWNPTYGNTASATNSAVLGGWGSLADRYGMQAHQNGRFAANGDAQRIRAVLRCATTTNAAVEMALDGGTTYLTIPSGKVMYGEIYVVGVRAGGADVAIYRAVYAAKNIGGLSTEVFSSVTTDAAVGTSLEVATVDQAGASTDYIRIRPTGTAGQNWRWVAKVDMVEVGHG
jgi:hypothetical protein